MSETLGSDGMGFLEQGQELDRGRVPVERADDVRPTGGPEGTAAGRPGEQGQDRLDEPAGIGDRPVHSVAGVVADDLAVGVEQWRDGDAARADDLDLRGPARRND